MRQESGATTLESSAQDIVNVAAARRDRVMRAEGSLRLQQQKARDEKATKKILEGLGLSLTKDRGYVVQLRVPSDVREAVGLHNLRKVLGVMKEHTAKVLAVPVVLGFVNCIRQHRGEPALVIPGYSRQWEACVPTPPLTPELSVLVAKEERHAIYRQRRRPKRMVEAAIQRAAQKGLPCDLTPGCIEIPDACPYCGDAFIEGQQGGGRKSPSLDRIVPSLGYLRCNVQVLCMECNMIKGAVTDPNRIIRVGQAFLAQISGQPR